MFSISVPQGYGASPWATAVLQITECISFYQSIQPGEQFKFKSKPKDSLLSQILNSGSEN